MAGSPQGGTTTNASNFSMGPATFGGPQQATQPNYDGTGMPIVGQIIDDYGDFVPPHLRQIDNQRRIGDGLAPRTDYGPETIEAYNAANPSNFRTMAQNNRPQGQSYSQPKALNSGVQQMAAPQQGGYNVNTASAQGLQQAQQGAAADANFR